MQAEPVAATPVTEPATLATQAPATVAAAPAQLPRKLAPSEVQEQRSAALQAAATREQDHAGSLEGWAAPMRAQLAEHQVGSKDGQWEVPDEKPPEQPAVPPTAGSLRYLQEGRQRIAAESLRMVAAANLKEAVPQAQAAMLKLCFHAHPGPAAVAEQSQDQAENPQCLIADGELASRRNALPAAGALSLPGMRLPAEKPVAAWKRAAVLTPLPRPRCARCWIQR